MDIQEQGAGVTFPVRVVPRAGRNEVVGNADGALKVRLTAPAVEGRANQALVRFLAGRLGVRRGDVTIVAGEHARHKLVRVEGLTAVQVQARLMDRT